MKDMLFYIYFFYFIYFLFLFLYSCRFTIICLKKVFLTTDLYFVYNIYISEKMHDKNG